jgi:Cu-processing system ATP-binding protein
MIEYRGASKRFGEHVALAGLSLRVQRGEVVALLGPNGSGKTTALKLAAGLIKPDAGDVLVGDPPARPWQSHARRVLSYLPQRVAFPDALTGREVVEFYSKLRGLAAERSDAVLQFASLNGAGQRAVSTYSGGMVQRLGLAVAMLPDAPLLLLDEPTAALDPDGLCAFYGLVQRRQSEGRTIFFSSHQVGDVERLADRFLVLVHGRLVTSLTQAALRGRLADRGVMRVRLDRKIAGLIESARALAPAATWAAGELIVPGPASVRPAILDLIRSAGGEIRGLTAEDGRLETLYRELVGQPESAQ